MAAATTEIKTDAKQHPVCYELGEPARDYVGAEVVTFYAGTIACRTLATGLATPGATATGLKALGRVKQTVAWSAAELALGKARPNVRIETGTFGWVPNDGETFTIADKDKLAYVVDNRTVSKVATGKSVAGTIADVSEGKVWVTMGPDVLTVTAQIPA